MDVEADAIVNPFAVDRPEPAYGAAAYDGEPTRTVADFEAGMQARMERITELFAKPQAEAVPEPVQSPRPSPKRQKSPRKWINVRYPDGAVRRFYGLTATAKALGMVTACVATAIRRRSTTQKGLRIWHDYQPEPATKKMGVDVAVLYRDTLTKYPSLQMASSAVGIAYTTAHNALVRGKMTSAGYRFVRLGLGRQRKSA